MSHGLAPVQSLLPVPPTRVWFLDESSETGGDKSIDPSQKRSWTKIWAWVELPENAKC